MERERGHKREALRCELTPTAVKSQSLRRWSLNVAVDQGGRYDRCGIQPEVHAICRALVEKRSRRGKCLSFGKVMRNWNEYDVPIVMVAV